MITKGPSYTAILLLAAACSSLAAVAQDAPRTRYRELRIPGRDRFPVPEAKLLEMRDAQKVAAMRDHAWKLFAGLTHAEGPKARRPPIWDSWYTKCDVQLADCLPASGIKSNQERLLAGLSFATQNLGALSPPEKLQGVLRADQAVPRELLLQTERDIIASYLAADPQLASVLYNRPAMKHFRKNSFFSSAYLSRVLDDRIRSNSPENERKIAPFPANSVVLKTAWQVVPPADDKGLTKIAVWDSAKEIDENVVKEGFANGATDWGKMLTIDTRKTQKCSDRD